MSSGGGAGPLNPTFHGFVHNSMDGLVLFEACLSGKLQHVPRRPHDRERNSLIKSGSIFIYEENASGIKRWTDGVAWSPSRILGNFLIYRELEKPFPPGEKKRAMKRKRSSLPGEPYPRRESDDADAELPTPLTPPSPVQQPTEKSDVPTSERDKELERSLIGSLVDSYGFRPDGLVKKTMSISVNGISHHMVSYYKVDDVKNDLLQRPLSDHRLQNISVRPELYLKQNFRAPVEETEHYAIDGQMHAHPQMMYSNLTGSPYNIRPGQYFGGQYGMYGMSSGANLYGGLTGTAWSGGSTQSLSYGGHAAYGTPTYGTPYYKSSSGADKPDASPSTSQASGYGNQYASSYPAMSRNTSQGTPALVQSSYSPANSSYPPMSSHISASRNSYGGASSASTSIHSPTGNAPPPHAYSSSASQSYAVRTPTQSYSMQSAPSSAIAHSPHSTIKSPISATHTPTEASGPMHASTMHYRTSATGYSVPPAASSGPANGDMNGLGISGAGSYSSHAQSSQNYGGYGSAPSAFRPVSEVTAGSGTAQYAN